MRPIDADALIDKVLKHYTEQERSYNLVFAACEIKQVFADIVCDAPTLDYKDLVPQGEWEFVRADENDMPIYRCTNCKTKRYGKPPFCPQCGARMTK